MALSHTCSKDDVENSQMNGILALKLNIDDCYVNVLLELQQRRFNSRLLAIGLCYSCGRILWNSSHAHCSGLTTPSRMTSDDAPAMAYLRASPNSNLTFVHMKGDCE